MKYTEKAFLVNLNENKYLKEDEFGFKNKGETFLTGSIEDEENNIKKKFNNIFKKIEKSKDEDMNMLGEIDLNINNHISSLNYTSALTFIK